MHLLDIMITRKTIPQSILRRLYAHSGNRCAFPECHAPLFEENGLLTGECCHIEAYSPQGARFNNRQTDEERNSYDNLVLMCPRHHKIIDNDTANYTVERIKEIKYSHEMAYSAENLELDVKQIETLQNASSYFWSRIEDIDRMNPELIDLKRFADVDKSVEQLLEDIEQTYQSLLNTLTILGISDNELTKDIREFIIDLGYDVNVFDTEIQTNQNPFLIRNWEAHCLAIPNITQALKTMYFEIIIRLLERVSTAEKCEHPLLPIYRERFAEFQKENYYAD